ncbi:NifU family protein [Myroides ceti]|uniref:NifU family protein n=1 Tax=Paenimyroides ceti TaxID=395087 RepID=A0ABT8CUR7_9FLAO|nr:NifU family protein [Paenimyroides ceti]MDN3708259.1 NifU family protein [Paenimyroides ceti]
MTTTSETIRLNVEKALDEIRPFLKSDGGDINLISIEDDKYVTVQLLGACISCNVNQMTLKAGVETTIKKYAPEIETVTNISELNNNQGKVDLRNN